MKQEVPVLQYPCPWWSQDWQHGIIRQFHQIQNSRWIS